MVQPWTAFRALLALTTTIRMHRRTAPDAPWAHSHRKVPRSASRALPVSTTTIWIRPLLAMMTPPPALQATTLARVARDATGARVAQLIWTVTHLRRVWRVTLARTQLRARSAVAAVRQARTMLTRTHLQRVSAVLLEHSACSDPLHVALALALATTPPQALRSAPYARPTGRTMTLTRRHLVCRAAEKLSPQLARPNAARQTNAWRSPA